MTIRENDQTAQNGVEDFAHDIRGTIGDIIEDLRTADILLNNKKVRLPKHRITGAEIKSAAIEQGVPIQADFLLWWERGGGREQQVGDHTTILVLDGARFTAIGGDDNS
jgi:hypothetical protein